MEAVGPGLCISLTGLETGRYLQYGMAGLDAAHRIPGIIWLGLDASRSLLTARRWMKCLQVWKLIQFILNDIVNMEYLYNKIKNLDIAGRWSDGGISSKLK
ncbi:hypothetical protein ELH27_37110 [Rhizobium leguminosarum]|uniref:Uncharacterized protein n=1 Tax=Rhizobium beringeri TaxID=3019934 RepID=A0ABY1XHD6_9HYPH|nr:MULTISPECIES: hypothetical protein [Rhizobium]TBC53789.1 hypothetical protein ELH27_37110 [Rhizobium leguminosarum]TBE57575.1 hypothetical protein ELH03_36945 [Rhizobium beringeri]